MPGAGRGGGGARDDGRDDRDGGATPEDLLGAIIDITADSRDLALIFDRDPAALAIVDAQLPRSSQTITEETVAAVAGPDPAARR